MKGIASLHIGTHRTPHQDNLLNDSSNSTAKIHPLHSLKLTCSKAIKAIGHIFLAAIGGLTYLFSFGCWGKGKEFTSKHFTLAKEVFYPSLQDKKTNQKGAKEDSKSPDDKSASAQSDLKKESENQTPPSSPETPNQIASASHESSSSTLTENESKVARAEIQKKHENQTPPSSLVIPNQIAPTSQESSGSASTENGSKVAGAEIQEKHENQTPPSSSETPNQIASTSQESSSSTSTENGSKIAEAEMQEKHESPMACPQNISSLSLEQIAPKPDEDNIEFLLANMFNAAQEQLETEENKSFNYENTTDWNSIKRKQYFPQNINPSNIGGSFCINPTRKNATIPLSGKIKFSTNDKKEHRFDLYGLLSNHLENLKPNDLLLEQKKLIGQAIAKFLSIHNPDKISDLGIYNALKETLIYLETISKENQSNFSATFAITLNQKLWIAHSGSSAALLSNQGNPVQLSVDQFSIIGYPVEEFSLGSKLILISGDVKKVASGKQIVKGEYKANKGFLGANNGSAARQIACAAHAAGAEQDIAVLVIKLSEIQ